VIGVRLVPLLVAAGHEVAGMTRSPGKLESSSSAPLGSGRDLGCCGECGDDYVVVVGGDNAAGGGSVRPVELARVRGRLVAFAEEMLAPLARSDQRRWGEVYLRGLMLEGKRKSIEPMAARLADGDEQCLQQFVNQSPWEWQPVRQRFARKLTAAIVPEAWIVDDTGFPKFGRDSVGVARQYCGALGKVGNCQVGVSINAATDEASCPLDWRLFLPEEWDGDSHRRAKAHLPAQERHRPKWRLALEMLDGLCDDGLEPGVIVADGGYGEISEFRLQLEARELTYVLQVKGGTSAYPRRVRRQAPAYQGSGRPPKPRYREQRSSLKTLVLAAGRESLQTVAWREGSRGKLSSRFLALRVRPANVQLRRAAGEDELPLAWLVCEWPDGEDEPAKYWLSNLPEDTPLDRLVSLAKLRWRVEHDYRELKDALGLDHFEGRSFRGWHHHVTLVTLAHGFLTLERLNPKALAPA
jgi:SRSO17 transposase